MITHPFQTAVRGLSMLALAGGVTLLGACAMQANSADPSVYQRAVDSPIRTAADREADAGRKPMAFLQFTQVRTGDKVMDMAAGAGYTSQLLALVTAPTGITWAQTPKAGPKLQERISAHPDTGMELLVQPFEDPYPADKPRLDLVTLVMNYHDIAYLPVDRAKMNKHIFDALKPGGHFVVIDHSAKPGTGVSVAKTLHRIDEATVKDELKQAGFVLEEESDFLRQPTDPREQAFFDMKGEASDKFALRFVRP